MTSSATQQQQRETESLLFDQQECVTVGRLVTRLGVSRSTASQLLSTISSSTSNNKTALATTTVESSCREIPSSNQDDTKETVPCTVFSLRTTNEKPVNDNNNHGFVYAMSPVLEESNNGNSAVASMHEQTLAVWRDLIRQRDTIKLQECVDAAQDVVTASQNDNDKQAWKERWAQYQTPSTNVGSMTVSHRTGSSTSVMKKKPVTAASFFGSSSSGSTVAKSASASTSKASSSKSGAAAKSSKSGAAAKSSAATTKSKKPASATTRSTSAAKKQSAKSNTKTGALSSAFAKAEKENKNKQHKGSHDEPKEKPSTAVGTADDFVGDMDDDDDDDDSVANIPSQNEDNDVEMVDVEDANKEDDDNEAVSKRKHEEENEQPMEVDDDNDAAEPEAPEAPQEKRRARRKKLVDKTTVDQKGYIITETHAVWEEIPSDEEEKTTKTTTKTTTKPKPKKKPTNGKATKMKQKSLASFFKK